VSENRSLWTAISVALLSIGLGGYVSLRVGAAFVGHRLDQVVETTLCLAITATGVTLIVVLSTIFFHLWRVKNHIAKVTLEAIDLMLRVRANTGNLTSDLTKLIDEFRIWDERTQIWLEKNDYIAYVHFINEAGQPTLVDRPQNKDSSLRKLDVRLTRLAEITTQKL
jgi:hypothetical protein